jgi:hypothetical protein
VDQQPAPALDACGTDILGRFNFRSNVCSVRMFELTALGVYVCIVPAGLVALVARRPTSLSVRAAEPRDDQQAHNDGQNAQDAVHSLPGVAAPFCCTRVV